MIKAVGRRVLPDSIQASLSRMFGKDVPISYGYKIIKGGIQTELLYGWQDPSVAEKQDKAFAPLLQQMHNGKPREDFVALANAVKMTGTDNPLIIEVGCGSGWNSEVLAYILKYPFRYIGVDYSLAMTMIGKQNYPNIQFITSDATTLSFKDRVCDILLSGTVLMHLLGYREAIQESRRVTKQWCIFHTLPVVYKRSTTMLRKFAYNTPVVEIVFNEEEFLKLIKNEGFIVRQVLESVSHDYLSHTLGEPVSARTYLCEIAQ